MMSLISLAAGVVLTAATGLWQRSNYVFCGPSVGQENFTDTVGVSLYQYYKYDRGLPLDFYSSCRCLGLYQDNRGCESKSSSHEWSITGGLADVVIWSVPAFLLQLPFMVRKKK